MLIIFWLQLAVEQEKLEKLLMANEMVQETDDDVDDEIVLVWWEINLTRSLGWDS